MMAVDGCASCPPEALHEGRAEDADEVRAIPVAKLRAPAPVSEASLGIDPPALVQRVVFASLTIEGAVDGRAKGQWALSKLEVMLVGKAEGRVEPCVHGVCSLIEYAPSVMCQCLEL